MQATVTEKKYVKELDWTEWDIIHPKYGLVHVHASKDESGIPFIYAITDNGVKLAEDSQECVECYSAIDVYERDNRPANWMDEDYEPPTPDEMDTVEFIDNPRERTK